MERHFSFLFLTLFIFAYSYQLTYGNDYEFVTRCTRSRKKSAELNLLITITCNNTKKNSDLFFYEIFPLFSSSKKCQIIFLLPEKKNYVKEKSFINTKVIVSHLMRIQFFLLFSLCQFIFLLLYLGSNTLRCFFSFAFFSILQRISLIFFNKLFEE